MPGSLSQVGKQVTGIWTQLSAGQRFTTVLVLAAAVLALGGISWFAGQPDYVAITSSSSPEEMQELSAALGDAGITYKLDGASILVDNRSVAGARNALARAGLPGREGSLKALDGAGNLTLSRPLQSFKLQLIQAQMVEQQVRQVDGVRSARVKANVPEPRLFVGEAEAARPSASVTIKLRPGTPLGQVGPAIVTLVSNGLGIPRDNVSVVDSTGAQYLESDALGGTGPSAVLDRDALALDKAMSDEHTVKVQRDLDRIYRGKAIVRINVALDHTHETTQETILPTEKILLSEKKKEKTLPATSVGGDPSVAAGAAGNAGSGTPQPAVLRAPGKDIESEKTYQGPIGTRRTAKLASQIKRITVSLALDKALEAKAKDIEGFVKQAVGFDLARKDDVTTTIADFPPEEKEPDTPVWAYLPLVKEYGTPVAQVLCLVLVLVFLRGLLKRAGRVDRSKVGVALVPGAAARPGVPGAPALAEDENARMRAEIEQMVATDPAIASRLLEAWLAGRG